MSGISLDTAVRRKSSSVKDFCVATPEEFVKRFGGNVVINKVTAFFSPNVLYKKTHGRLDAFLLTEEICEMCVCVFIYLFILLLE